MPHHNLARVCATTLERSAILTATLLLLLLTVFAAGARAASDETAGDTFPASVTQAGVYANENTGGASTGGAPSISADGRYVAFISDAQNLDEQDPPAPPAPAGVQEAYVKDLHTGEMKLVSRANGLEGEPANEPGEGIGVEDPSISGNGRYVIFTSAASNVVSGLPSAAPGEHPLHVYRRDLQTGETTLVDRVNGKEGAILGERGARAEAISADGRYVLFRDGIEDLENAAGSHEPGLNTVYVRDLQVGTTTAVSRADGASGELANEPSRGTSISPEGLYVAFESAATNLVAGMQSNTVRQVYLRDLQTDTTTLASATPTGEPANGPSEEPLLLSGGCQVAFSSQATNLYLYEGAPVLTPEVYLADLCSTPASVTLVSRADGQDGAPAAEGNAVIPTPLGASSDRSYILFSAFSELTGEASHEREHLYLRNLNTGQTTLVDRQSGAAGEPAQGNPEGAALSANGCRVAFATQADNLGEPLRLETYVRNLAPCEPPAAEEHHQGTEETKSGEETSNGANPGKQAGSGGQPNTAGQPAATFSSAAETVPAGASTKCVVPIMRALDLTAVERALSAARCALGHVTYHYNAIPKGGLVEQSQHQGTIRPAGTKINIWLSKGRDYKWRPRRHPSPATAH